MLVSKAPLVRAWKYQTADWVVEPGLPDHHLRIIQQHVDPNSIGWYSIFDTRLAQGHSDYSLRVRMNWKQLRGWSRDLIPLTLGRYYNALHRAISLRIRYSLGLTARACSGGFTLARRTPVGVLKYWRELRCWVVLPLLSLNRTCGNHADVLKFTEAFSSSQKRRRSPQVSGEALPIHHS